VDNPRKLIGDAVNLADIAQRNGLLALEGQPIGNAFMKKGIDPTIQCHEVGQRMFKGVADIAPPWV